MMRAPAAGLEIDFDIASARRFVANLHHGPAKIRPRFVVCKTRMKHPHIFPVQGRELIAQEPLVLPDGLQQMFRRRGFMVFPEHRHYAAAGAPLGVEIGR